MARSSPTALSMSATFSCRCAASFLRLWVNLEFARLSATASSSETSASGQLRISITRPAARRLTTAARAPWPVKLMMSLIPPMSLERRAWMSVFGSPEKNSSGMLWTRA
jgi:hypothetical protein